MAKVQRLSELSKKRCGNTLRQFFILVLTVVIGVLISVTVNAQNSERKTSSDRKIKTSYPYKKKNRARVNHYASNTHSTEKGLEIRLTSNSFERSLIREMVASNLSGIDKLAPLVFNMYQNRMAADDLNPLLIAVEYARLGKNISIENAPNSEDMFDLSMTQLEEIRSLMCKMGVPTDKVTIATHTPSQCVTSTHGYSRIEFNII